MQAMSRAMYEAVRFDEAHVTSIDWLTYPIADITDTPDSIEVVLVNNAPANKSLGAGEPATRPVAAAIGNAIFDATGVRIRRKQYARQLSPRKNSRTCARKNACARIGLAGR